MNVETTLHGYIASLKSAMNSGKVRKTGVVALVVMLSMGMIGGASALSSGDTVVIDEDEDWQAGTYEDTDVEIVDGTLEILEEGFWNSESLDAPNGEEGLVDIRITVDQMDSDDVTLEVNNESGTASEVHTIDGEGTQTIEGATFTNEFDADPENTIRVDNNATAGTVTISSIEVAPAGELDSGEAVDVSFVLDSEAAENEDIVSFDTLSTGFLGFFGDDVESATVENEFMFDAEDDSDTRTAEVALEDVDVAQTYSDAAEDAESGDLMDARASVEGDAIPVFYQSANEDYEGTHAVYDEDADTITYHIDSDEYDRTAVLVDASSNDGYGFFEGLSAFGLDYFDLR